MKIAWSAIVKNEAAVIDRCVQSLLPYIDYGIVVDTGSEDQTPEKISRLFAQARKPFELYYAPFVDFSQARNVALQKARESKFDWDYLLLADADMELRVERPLQLNGGLSYDMRQTAGGMTYWNRRILNRRATGIYRGVTHEYLDVGAAERCEDAYFIDHADGANRPEKLQRDVALLEKALETETETGLIERYHFYLANSFFDLGRWSQAAEHYEQRIKLGGFDEERWYAQLRYAQCLGQLGDNAGYVWAMLQAYEARPQRAETLYDLAKFFREREGRNFSSLLFSDFGQSLPRPNDLLFVSDHVYSSGLKEEFAICAYYDERRRKRGAIECNKLALAGSEQARFNLFWYLQPLTAHVPSFKPQRIAFIPPEGYVACNPSVINHNNQPLVLVRTVNYTISPEGRYVIRDVDGSSNDRNPICTRNFLVSPTLMNAIELLLPGNFPESKFDLVRGFEDSRLFQRGQELWTLSTVRELTHEGWCEQVLAPLGLSPEGWCYGDRWQQILLSHRVHEKNWMPWPYGHELQFVYRLGTLVNSKGEVIAQHDPGFDVSHISGGSQVVHVDDRTWLAVVHEARTIPGRPNRYYQHRFVTFLADGRVDRISPPFFFHDKQIEFCAGLAYFIEDDELMVSYGVRDCEAWLARMQLDEVLAFVYGGTL